MQLGKGILDRRRKSCRKNSIANENGRWKKLSAEILQVLISAKLANFPATANECMMQRFNILIRWLKKALDAEILQILLFVNFVTIHTTTAWWRNFASLATGLKTLDAEILQILLSAKLANIPTTTVWCRNSYSF